MGSRHHQPNRPCHCSARLAGVGPRSIFIMSMSPSFGGSASTRKPCGVGSAGPSISRAPQCAGSRTGRPRESFRSPRAGAAPGHLSTPTRRARSSGTVCAPSPWRSRATERMRAHPGAAWHQRGGPGSPPKQSAAVNQPSCSLDAAVLPGQTGITWPSPTPFGYARQPSYQERATDGHPCGQRPSCHHRGVSP